MNIYDLDTPALVVDLDRLERNIASMAGMAREVGKALRPHTKTHKTPEIARMQAAAGAQGITVAKLGEAEVMARAGFRDIFVANQIVGERKIERLIAEARDAAIIVGADSLESVAPIAHAANAAGVTISVRIEVDTGMHRAGLRDVVAVVGLARVVEEMAGVQLDGLYTYEGHANLADESDRRAACSDSAERLRLAAAAVRDAGIECEHLSVGSSAGAAFMAREDGITELRAGVYVFNDRGQVSRGAAEEDCALTVLATVISRPDERTAIVDAGSKSLSGDRDAGGNKYGDILEVSGAGLDWVSEEHGHVALAEASMHPRVGEKLRIVPYHACTCTNMHDVIHGVRGERVEVEWGIAGRGRIQ